MAKRFIGGELVSSVAPAGSVTAFAGESAPDGWLVCDGSEIDISQYPSLYAALGEGSLYDTQINPLTGSAWAAPASGKFRVPDFRGSFLRGAGTFTDGIGTNTSVGGYQTDMMQGHGHKMRFSTSTPVDSWQLNSGAGTSFGKAANGNGTAYGTSQIAGPREYDDGAPRSGKETRVRNKGVNYIIKY